MFFSVRNSLSKKSSRLGARAFRYALQVLAGEQALRQRRKRDASDAELFERGEQTIFDPAIEHGVRRLMNEQRDAHLLENACGFARTVRIVRRDADVERFALVHGRGERADGFFERAVLPRTVRVEDVDVVEAHAAEAIVERREEILARGANAVGARPHVPAGLGGNEKLVAQGTHVPCDTEVLPQNRAEVFFGRAVRRTVVIGEVEVRDAAVEGAADHGAAGLKDIRPAKVLPEAERDGRQHEAGVAAAAKVGAVVTRGIGNVGGFHDFPAYYRQMPASMRIICRGCERPFAGGRVLQPSRQSIA